MESSKRNFDCHAFATDDELAEAAAERFAARIMAARTESRLFSVALSGGRIAHRFFAAAAKLIAAQGAIGSATHFFWADERCVPPDHPESNYRTASELLLETLAVPAFQIHRIPGELPPAAAASRAATEFANVMARNSIRPPRVDLALLGMGEDGHIASLFPEEPVNTQADPAIFRAVVGPKPPPNRVTMGYFTLAAAREVWVLVSGTGKESALKESLSTSGKTPLARLLGMRPTTRILSSVHLPLK